MISLHAGNADAGAAGPEPAASSFQVQQWLQLSSTATSRDDARMRAITIALAVVVGFAGAELLHSFAAHADPTGKPTTLKEAKDAAAAKAAELAASKPCKSWEIGQQVVKLTNTDGKLLATGDGFEPFAVVTSPAVNAPDAIVLERRCAANW